VPYALANLVRVHRDTLVTLAERAEVYESDALDELLARAMAPMPGVPDDSS
jgi:hypothetical protein